MTRKNRKPTKGIFVAVDESSHFVLDGMEVYAVVASVTNDRRAFRNVVEDLDLDFEIGLSSDEIYADHVLTGAGQLLDSLYVAYAVVPENLKWKARKSVHLGLLGKLNEILPYGPKESVLVMVDQKSGISDEAVKSILGIEENAGDRYSVVVVPSNYFCEIQTHDYVAGATTRHIAGNDEFYDLLGKGFQYKEVRMENRKRRSSPSRPGYVLAKVRVRPFRGGTPVSERDIVFSDIKLISGHSARISHNHSSHTGLRSIIDKIKPKRLIK